MKKIFHALLLPLLVAVGCTSEGELTFPYESPQFETDPSFILMEVVPPIGSSARDAIWIVGDFNGGEDAAVGDDAWKLTPAPSGVFKWGIYLDPAKFVSGKGLADGYYFVSETQGRERDYENGDVVHTETAAVGGAINYVRIVRWAKHFDAGTAIPWPDVPADMIQLRLTIPEATPEGYPLNLYGDLNGWNGGDAKWQAVPIDEVHYFINLLPSDLQGSGLNGNWKFSVIRPDQDWWWHQQNDSGVDDSDGQGVPIADAVAGKAYEVVIPNWRHSASLPESAPKTYIMVTVPATTPTGATVRFVGEPNGWNGGDAAWDARFVRTGLYLITIDPTSISEGKSLDNKFFFAAITAQSSAAGRDWWYHQNNDTGGGEEETTFNDRGTEFKGATVNTTYFLVVPNWRNNAELVSGVYQ